VLVEQAETAVEQRRNRGKHLIGLIADDEVNHGTNKARVKRGKYHLLRANEQRMNKGKTP